MKDVKTMIPIITLVLLICVLAGTFAWFSSYANVEMTGILSVERPMRVTLDQSSLGDLTDYQGQTGYNADGSESDTANRPYIIQFDLAFRAIGEKDVDVYFGFEYIAVKLNEQNLLSIENAIKLVFDKDFVNENDNVNKYLGTKAVSSYVSTDGDKYYAKTESGMQEVSEGTQITTYAAQYDTNADVAGMIILAQDDPAYNDNLTIADKSKVVSEIVIKREYCDQFFHLQYATYTSNYNSVTSAYEFVDDSATTDVRFATPLTLTSTLNGRGHSEVNLDANKCIPQKAKITIGLYHDYGSVTGDRKSQFGTFTFSNDAFRGCKFSFAFCVIAQENKGVSA
ncbi:MAG: hypothetical protein ACI4MY_07690 [Christensenellales bacterium]